MTDDTAPPLTHLPPCLAVAAAPAVTVPPHVPAPELAPALLLSAGLSLPLSAASVEQRWNASSVSARTALVLRIARILPSLDGLAATRLADPGWRYAAGLPLALAFFIIAMRGRRAHRAYNTLQAWRSDWKQWRTWCKRHGRPSFNPSPLQLRDFFADYAPTHKVATIRRLGSTLTAMHKAAGFPDPLSQPLSQDEWLSALKSPRLLAAKQMAGRRGVVERPPAGRGGSRATPKAARPDRRDEPVDQAEGLRFELLKEILEKIDTRTLIGARDAALLATAYDLLGRRSEVVALTVDNVRSDRVDTSGTALIERSKTDQAGEGAILYLRAQTLERIRHWLQMAKIAEGPLFRPLPGFAAKGAVVIGEKPLGAREFSRIVQRRVGAVLRDKNGLPSQAARLFSGHSCRVGAAQDLAETGATDLEIMHAGRWRSLAQVARYTAKVRAKFGGMAKLAAKQEAGATPA